MSFSKHSRFRLHEFEVIPPENVIVRPDGKRSVRPASIDVLLLLGERSGEFIQHDEILETVFSSSAGNEELLATCIAELRSCLSDTDPEPRFIESSDEHGYRLLVSLVALDDRVFETDAGRIEAATQGKDHALQQTRAEAMGEVLDHARESLLRLVGGPLTAPAQERFVAVLPNRSRRWRF